MTRRLTLAALSAVFSAVTLTAPAATAQARPRQPLVEFEMMTWPEVKDALAAGKTTALFYTGGTEQRGPQNVNGGHNLMGRVIVRTIAERLGNAIAMPVLPYTPNNASATLPGTIGLTPELLKGILERISEQSIATGFKTVVLMGDHGGGQPNVYADVAKALSEKYASQGVKVLYCDAVYSTANADFDAYLKANGFPPSSHAGIPDTSTMLYLGDGTWVRLDQLPNALGDPVPTGPRGAAPDPNAPPRKNNGITGDARKASKELGKKLFEMKVDYAVKQIKEMASH